MKSSGLMWLAACVLLVPGTGRAERHFYPLTEAQVIVSPQAEERVLLDFTSMEDLRDVIVTSAFLEVPLPASVREQDLEVSVYAVSRAWRGRGATWTSPWTRAGGDLDESYFHEITIHAGQSAATLRLNVTQVVDAIVTEGTPSYGLVLTTPLRRADGFTTTQRSLLGTMAGARLVVTTANARAAEPRQGE